MTNTETPLDVVTRAFASMELEHDRNAYVRALRECGWTIDPIGLASGLSREQVRRIESSTPLRDATLLIASGVPVPPLSVIPARSPRSRSRRNKNGAPDPSPETLARLKELKPLAELVRSSSPRYRAEAEEYCALLDHAIRVEGTTVYRLAILLGVTHGALYFRLTRYGYRTSPGSTNKVYQAINPDNRAQ